MIPTLCIQSTDNLLFTLYNNDYLYSHSILFKSLIEDDNNETDTRCALSEGRDDNEITLYPIPFKSSIFNMLRICNLNICKLFGINKTIFIEIYKFLTYILFEPDDKFITKFIIYMVNNNINYLESDLLHNEILNINNYLNNVKLDIQIQQTSIIFYVTIIRNKFGICYELIIKHNRIDLFNIERNIELNNMYKKHINDRNNNTTEEERYFIPDFYHYVHLYDNDLTNKIKQEHIYTLYISTISMQLYNCCKYNRINDIQRLLLIGADCTYYDVEDEYGNDYNAIEIAIKKNYYDIVKILLEYDYTLIEHSDMVFTRIMTDKYINIINLLLSYGIIDYIKRNREIEITLLTNACEKECINIIQLLLDNNIMIYMDVFNNIFRQCDINIIKLLINYKQSGRGSKELNGFNINEVDDNNVTLLMIASMAARSDIVEYLLVNGVDINTINNFGETAKDIAQLNGYNDIVNLITLYEKI